METRPADRSTAYSARVDAALTLSAAAHEGQRRKGTGVPYVMHPVHVARILEHHRCSEDVVVAGLLHDVVEDARVDDQAWRVQVRAAVRGLAGAPDHPDRFAEALSEYIRTVFGDRVSALVAHVTEQKTDGDGIVRPWEVRKAEQLDALAWADDDTLRLKAADALHNMETTTRDLYIEGGAVFSRFRRSAVHTLWYYRTMTGLIAERLGASDTLACELTRAFDNLAHAARTAGGLDPMATPPGITAR